MQSEKTESWICDIMKQLLQALVVLHHERLIHGAICPSNILVNAKKGAKGNEATFIEAGVNSLFRLLIQWVAQLIVHSLFLFFLIPVLSQKRVSRGVKTTRCSG